MTLPKRKPPRRAPRKKAFAFKVEPLPVQGSPELWRHISRLYKDCALAAGNVAAALEKADHAEARFQANDFAACGLRLATELLPLAGPGSLTALAERLEGGRS